ncbi:MAG: DUF4292 domain-containing protein [Bacteroidetes bacterium]|nr:DUF4292 domain-containing protein [Bacteroidota bacterium]
MNRIFHFALYLMSGLVLTQCGVSRGVTEKEAPVEPAETPALVGMKGLGELCGAYDTINSVLISKAETMFITSKRRYQAQVTIYALKDSLIYMSAVNNGFEIIRAAVDGDTIRVIDRINKIVYRSPVRRRLGYQNPVNYSDIQNLVSRYFLCDDIDDAKETNFFHLEFQFNEPHLKKNILLDRHTLLLEEFEYLQTETGKFFMGEKGEEGFIIYSNFMVDEFEIVAKGGEVSYNRSIEVKMDVNQRKYSFVNF